MKKKYIITFAAAALILAGCSHSVSNAPPGNGDTQSDSPDQDTSAVSDDKQTKKRDTAPAFSLKDGAGQTVSLEDFAGKPVIVNSWAVWCPFCRAELEDFAEIQKEFGDSVTFVAIDRAESLKLTQKFTDELGVTDDLVFLLDPSDSFYSSIAGFSMPETLFVDADGGIQFHKRGVMALDEIRERTQTLIDEHINR